MDFNEHFDANILLLGEVLSTEERNKLPDKAFGVPSERKFPLTDKGHVLSAISYFHTYEGSKENKNLLARNIVKAAKKYGVELSPDSAFMNYYKGMNEEYIRELSTGGLSYYAPLTNEEIGDAFVEPLHGTNICSTPNELSTIRLNLSSDELSNIDKFKSKIHDTFIMSEKEIIKYTHFFQNFPDILYEYLSGNLSEEERKEFPIMWNTIIEMAKDTSYKELIYEVMGKNLEDRFDNIIFTENFIPNKYNKLFRTLKEGFLYYDLSEVSAETIEEDLMKEGFVINEATRNKVLQGLDKWEGLMDDIFEEYFKVPIYVVLTKGKTAGNQIVSKITKTPYGHASLAFDLSLDKVYSFGTNFNNRNPNGKFMTFVEESKEFWNNLSGGELKYYIFAIFIDKKKKEKMWKSLKSMVKNKTKFSYNYLGIFGYLLNTPVKVKDSFFCSEFIASLFKTVGIDLFDKPDSLVAPHDFALSNKFMKIDEGMIKDYNPKKIERKVKAIMDKYYGVSGKGTNSKPEKDIMKSIQLREDAQLLEKFFKLDKYSLDDTILIGETFRLAKNTLPIEIDKDGNIVLHKLGEPNYDSVYAESHKLLIEYHKGNNIEGIKYELAKLWTCLKGIEIKIFDKKHSAKLTTEERKNLIDTRARIINDFKKYMKVVIESEPDFNFEHYYKESDYNSNIIKITRNTIKGITLLAKSLLL